MTTCHDVSFDESKVFVVFVDVVLFDVVGESAHNKEVIVSTANTASAVEDLLSFVTVDFLQGVRVVDVHPRVGISLGVIELSEVHGDVKFAILKTEVSVVVCDRDF